MKKWREGEQSEFRIRSLTLNRWLSMCNRERHWTQNCSEPFPFLVINIRYKKIFKLKLRSLNVHNRDLAWILPSPTTLPTSRSITSYTMYSPYSKMSSSTLEMEELDTISLPVHWFLFRMTRRRMERESLNCANWWQLTMWDNLEMSIQSIDSFRTQSTNFGMLLCGVIRWMERPSL